ncbi:unnamed protein product [Soboliphyme baturini]|uniref:DDHD domain-containing protein n=1 Tax=Soboliphyme baturini TaxID=241478 RepID=A0A183J377_9BILA|nr:unnamed protein product [Soboliphyme baturini]
MVPRYERFPLGDDQSTHILDCVQKSAVSVSMPQRCSGITLPRAEMVIYWCSNWSFLLEFLNRFVAAGGQDVAGDILSKWWGSKRIDYSLYCPEGISSFPVAALPNILHSSFWESRDVAAFIIRQLTSVETFTSKPQASEQFRSLKPTERWRRRHTSFKIRNIAPNHRANDVILNENAPQLIHVSGDSVFFSFWWIVAILHLQRAAKV